ncbi:MAG: hypothetical protein QMB49_04120, partial [Collinsella sp.]
MTEDIPLEITSSDMANLPIFIAVLIVATVVVRVYFSIKHNEKPPIARVFWCATLLIPLGMVAAWITNQLLVNEDNSLWVLSYSALGAAAVILLVEPLVSGHIDQTDLATGTVACICRDILVIAAVSAPGRGSGGGYGRLSHAGEAGARAAAIPEQRATRAGHR